MNKINWRVRLKNPVFVANLVVALLLPIVTYNNMEFTDLTTWKGLLDLIVNAFSNPFLLALVVTNAYGVINDPTVKGLTDSKRTMKKGLDK